MAYYTEDFQGVAGQTARAAHVQSEFAAIETAFSNVESDTNAAIKAPDGESPSRLVSAASRADKYMKFDSNGDPIVVDGPFDWRGDWATSTSYTKDDVVRAPDAYDKSLYIATSDHTSDASDFGNDKATKWDVLIDLAGLNFEKYDNVKSGNFTAEKGKSYQIDHSGNDVTVTLPSSPTEGDSPINLLLVNGDPSQGTQEVFVDPGSNTIMGGSAGELLKIDQQYASVRLIWTASYGWRTRTV